MAKSMTITPMNLLYILILSVNADVFNAFKIESSSVEEIHSISTEHSTEDEPYIHSGFRSNIHSSKRNTKHEPTRESFLASKSDVPDDIDNANNESSREYFHEYKNGVYHDSRSKEFYDWSKTKEEASSDYFHYTGSNEIQNGGNVIHKSGSDALQSLKKNAVHNRTVPFQSQEMHMYVPIVILDAYHKNYVHQYIPMNSFGRLDKNGSLSNSDDAFVKNILLPSIPDNFSPSKNYNEIFSNDKDNSYEGRNKKLNSKEQLATQNTKEEQHSDELFRNEQKWSKGNQQFNNSVSLDESKEVRSEQSDKNNKDNKISYEKENQSNKNHQNTQSKFQKTQKYPDAKYDHPVQEKTPHNGTLRYQSEELSEDFDFNPQTNDQDHDAHYTHKQKDKISNDDHDIESPAMRNNVINKNTEHVEQNHGFIDRICASIIEKINNKQHYDHSKTKLSFDEPLSNEYNSFGKPKIENNIHGESMPFTADDDPMEMDDNDTELLHGGRLSEDIKHDPIKHNESPVQLDDPIQLDEQVQHEISPVKHDDQIQQKDIQQSNENPIKKMNIIKHLFGESKKGKRIYDDPEESESRDTEHLYGGRFHRFQEGVNHDDSVQHDDSLEHDDEIQHNDEIQHDNEIQHDDEIQHYNCQNVNLEIGHDDLVDHDVSLEHDDVIQPNEIPEHDDIVQHDDQQHSDDLLRKLHKNYDLQNVNLQVIHGDHRPIALF